MKREVIPIERIAAYCRVSTEKEDQINSLESQKRYFTDYIHRNPAWQLVKIYADEGITGTSTKKRTAFKQMIADAKAHHFDYILTKEISRFARNTLDSIFYTRQLKELGIGVIFLQDNICTLDADAELRLTIMSSIAQEESRKTSARVKWGQKRRMEQGVVFGRDLLGYHVQNGALFLDPEGAETVQLIFHKFVHEEKSAYAIAKELEASAVPTATYMKHWSNTSILRILKNEKYCGDLIQKKTITPNYLNHEKKYNHGEEDFVILHNHHEPIISRHLFQLAQQMLIQRSHCIAPKTKYTNRYCFSGKIKCGICGYPYVSRIKKRQNGNTYHNWRCRQAVLYGKKHLDIHGQEVGCSNCSIREDTLQQILQNLIYNLPIDHKKLSQRLDILLNSIVSQTEPSPAAKIDLQEKLIQLTKKRQALLELFLNHEITKAEFQYTMDKLAGAIKELKKKQQYFKAIKNPPSFSQEQFLALQQTAHALLEGELWDTAFYRHILHHIVIKESQILEIYLEPPLGQFQCPFQ